MPEVGALGAAEKKVKMLEQQRTEVGGWRGWWSGKTCLPFWDRQDEALFGALALASLRSPW